MNFTIDNNLLSVASSEIVEANTLIFNLNSQMSSLKSFPPDYEYIGQVNDAISNIEGIFNEITSISKKFSTFLYSIGMIKEFSLIKNVTKEFPLIKGRGMVNDFSSANSSIFPFDIVNDKLNLKMNNTDTKKTMSTLINYYNYLDSKNDLTEYEKKTYDVLYPYVKSDDVTKFLNVADTINQHYRKSGVTYSTSDGIYSYMNDSKKSNKTCCATYVAQTLYDYNQEKYSRYNTGKINYNYCQTLYEDLKQDGSFKEVKNINDLQAGDVVFMRNKNNDKSQGIQHVQIYAGDNSWYNAGSNASIQRGKYQATDQNFRFVVAMRPDFKNNDVFEEKK